MRLNDYSVSDYTQVLDKLSRAKQVHNSSFHHDFTAEALLWGILSFVFENLAYIVVYPIIFIVVNLIKLLTQKN